MSSKTIKKQLVDREDSHSKTNHDQDKWEYEQIFGVLASDETMFKINMPKDLISMISLYAVGKIVAHCLANTH